MRLLQRSFDVETGSGGGFVQQIDGVAGGRRAGRPVDWFYYVNGIEARVGAAERRINPGDRVWWDHHDWGVTLRIPAVVGAFPEPFLSGDRRQAASRCASTACPRRRSRATRSCAGSTSPASPR